MSIRPEQKIGPFIWIIGVAFFVLFARLYYLQVIKGDQYLRRSESNFIQERVIKHNRGKILDSQNQVLVDNRLSYDLYITFALLPDSFRSLRAIGSALKMSKNDVAKINHEILLQSKERLNNSILLASDLSDRICNDVNEVIRSKMISGVSTVRNQINKKCELNIDVLEFPSTILANYRLRELLKISEPEFQEYWQRAQKKAQGLARFKPILLMSDIGFDSYSRIENAAALGLLAGVTVTPAKRRRYMYKDLGTHVVGFLNQVSIEELKAGNGIYRGGDYIGRKGVEAAFENELRGQDGIERLVVDAKGRRFSEEWERELLGADRIIEPKPGLNVKLSIDAELQRSAQDLFRGLSGSVVVMDVNTGFIKAMASFPSFDPNIIVGADNSKQLKELFSDKARPFRNKAIQDHYPPGSTFKPITAIAGLNRQLINPYTSHNCNGLFRLHQTTWRCYKREGHGVLTLRDALKHSCDSFFYDLGYRMGLDYLSTISAKLGFGQATEISLSGETSGILPSRSYYQKRLGYVAPGFVVNMAIGQGDLSVSPLQLAVSYAAIANGGTILKPQVVEEISDEEGLTIRRFDRIVKSTLSDSSLDFAEIMQGLSYVTEGSASSLRYKPEYADIAKWIKANNLMIVGKTGTAQVVALSKDVKHAANAPYERQDHAWFVGLFPKENPEIVVVVMTEHGGLGGAASAPTAVRIMKKWHEKNNSMVLSMREAQ
jgi:penicillin-binding protein 2